MSNLKLLGALLLTVGGTTQLLYAEQPSVIINSNIVQQKSTCSGVVKDASGESVIGASVLVKGTTIGTITDFDGNFELPNVEKGAVIQVSFVGYLTKEVIWKGTPISVVLEDDTKTLEEVVVVGYGTQKKVNLTGSVAMAESDVLEDRPIANLAQGLQGVIPNLNISFANGNPNAETSINVRGLTSLNGGSALVLVDGVETNDISLINPQDIESISVLKDASSAAVYGARAAFGVVLITTKKGKTGEKITFNYNNNFSWSTPSRLPHSLPADQWLRAMNNESKNTSGTQYWSDELIAAVDAYMKDPTRPTAWENTQGNKFTANGEWAYAGNTDWMDIFYKNAAFMQQHNASLRGGSEKTAYYASLGYKGQDGLLAFGTDTYKRINMSFNFTSKVTDWLEIGFRTKYNRSEVNEPNSNHYTSEDPYYEVYRAFPFIPVYLPDGDFAAVAGSNFNFNIAGMLAQAGRKKNVYDDIWYTGSFNLTPLKGLSIKGDYTGNRLFRDERAHNKTIYQKQPDGSQIAKGEPNGVSLRKYDDTYQALNLWAEYKFELPKSHSFTAMVGYNQESKKTSNFYGYVTDLYLNDAPIIDWANTKQKLEEEATIWAVQGAFFRLNYDYAGKYLVEVNGRYDGSSKFPKESRYGFFPSVSAGWNIAQEKFMESTQNWLGSLKLRASYGMIGNQNVPAYSFIPTMAVNNKYNGWISNGNYVTAITSIPSLVSRNFTWEKVGTLDIGIDFSMFSNRFTGTFDWYQRNTNGMLAPGVQLPAVVGADAPYQNTADMRTRGWELSFNWRDQIGKVSYRVGFNLSDSKSKIVKYDSNSSYILSSQKTNALTGGTYTFWEFYKGKELGEIWGYETDGYYTVDDFVDTSSWKLKDGVPSIDGYNPRPGDVKFKNLMDDERGTNMISSGNNTLNNPGDRKVIGNETPRYLYGINLGLNYKGFDLSAFLQGTGKRDKWIANTLTFPLYSDFKFIPLYKGLGDYWQPVDAANGDYTAVNPNAEFPRIYGNYGNQGSNYRQSDKYLSDASYLRIKNVTLSYTFPKAWITKISLSQLRAFVSVENLATFSSLPKGIDPETLKWDYPAFRTVSFGLNLTL